MDADIVIGQTDFSTNSAATSQFKFNGPIDVALNGNQMIVADQVNHRFLIYDTIPTTNFAPASRQIGQSSFSTAFPFTSYVNLRFPSGILVLNGAVYVADQQNHRILIYNSVPSSYLQPASEVLGQPDFDTRNTAADRTGFNRPFGVRSDGKRFYVGDYENNRVLIWNYIPTKRGDLPDVVVGQPDFNTVSAGNSQTKFDHPWYIFSDGQRLFVADANNNRVLIYNQIPTSNGIPADVVLGQPDFNSKKAGAGPDQMNFPAGIYSDGKRLFVAEFQNARVLVWNSIPTRNGQPADLVLGQPDFYSNSSHAGRNGMANPINVTSDGKKLFVSDWGNNRVLIFNIAGRSAASDLDPQFGQGKAVLGKVFEDRNGNGWQDKNERGLDGVKVVSDTGIYAITDEDGKYHFPYIETGQHILKIDESTLPDGAVVTTDNPYKVVVTEGVLTKVSFGVKLPASEVKETAAETSGPLLKVSMSQDASSLKPRLAVSAEQIRDKKDGKDKVVFTIDCNYYLFIKRAELKLYDSNEKEIKRIELPQPLPLKYEMPLSSFEIKKGKRNLYHYQLFVFDQKNKEDRTGIGSFSLREVSVSAP